MSLINILTKRIRVSYNLRESKDNRRKKMKKKKCFHLNRITSGNSSISNHCINRNTDSNEHN